MRSNVHTKDNIVVASAVQFVEKNNFDSVHACELIHFSTVCVVCSTVDRIKCTHSI